MTYPPTPLPIILASASPRRRELLGRLGLCFEVVAAQVDETPYPNERPETLAGRLSRAKAEAVAARHPDAVVIAADTVVAVRGDLLGKPQDAAQNRHFLEQLSGRSHEVTTGHTVMARGQEASRVVQSTVHFRTLSEREIDWYVKTGEGLDKAGGYGIQHYGAALVREIHGCYFNIVGLSVANLIELAQGLGVYLV